MYIEIRELTGFVAVASGAAMLVMSYVGAFFMGHTRGRREAERERREEQMAIGQVDHADRLIMVEGAIAAMAQAVERMTDAQRIALLERARTAAPGEPRLGLGRFEQRNTPA